MYLSVCVIFMVETLSNADVIFIVETLSNADVISLACCKTYRPASFLQGDGFIDYYTLSLHNYKNSKPHYSKLLSVLKALCFP